MFYKDYSPPHFHAVYGEYEISVDIITGIVEGKFPRRALNAVLEWYLEHKKELLLDWELAIKGKPLNKIPPLE
jgi:hypothetical protein